MFTKLTDLLDGFLAMGVPGYDCAVMKDGELVYRRSGGYSDLENRVPMKGDERYNIYSCSKPITCAAALQLYEKGLFSLDDRLSDYMPEFSEMTVKCGDTVKRAEMPILIKHLFTMTAGFSYNCFSPTLMKLREESGGACETRQAMKYLAQEPLLFEPGSRWEYSLCHDVLAALVEVISGERFGEYVRKNIFEPLNMTRSTFLLPSSELDTICEQYRFDSNEKRAISCGKPIQTYKLGSMYESGGAGAISTLEDYMKFLEAMRKGDIILKKKTIDLMTRDHLDRQTRKTYWYANYGYGLGVRTPIDGLSTDFGWGGAAGAFLMIDRENGITAYYAQHMLNSPNGERRKLIASIVKECLLGKAQAADTKDNVTAETLAKYQ